MLRHAALIALAVLCCGAVSRAQDEARAIAEKVTSEGADLFDARDARALAETYTDDATVFLVTRDQSTGRAKVDTKQGRQAIQSLYEDMFRDGLSIDAHNEVDYARLIGPDFLMIAGTFEIKRGLADVSRLPFVQLRVKQDNRWLIQSVRIVFMPQS